jgi:hypothetical protein
MPTYRVYYDHDSPVLKYTSCDSTEGKTHDTGIFRRYIKKFAENLHLYILAISLCWGVLSSNTGPETDYHEVFRVFPHSLQASVRMVPYIRPRNNRFLSYPFQFTIH